MLATSSTAVRRSKPAAITVRHLQPWLDRPTGQTVCHHRAVRNRFVTTAREGIDQRRQLHQRIDGDPVLTWARAAIRPLLRQRERHTVTGHADEDQPAVPANRPAYLQPSPEQRVERVRHHQRIHRNTTMACGLTLPLGERVGGVHPVPALRHRDPAHRLHHQCDRVRQRPHPPGGQGPWTLPQRAGRPEVRLHGDHVPGSHRQGPGPMDHALEDRPERFRHHLRRPPVGGPSVISTTAVTPLV